MSIFGRIKDAIFGKASAAPAKPVGSGQPIPNAGQGQANATSGAAATSVDVEQVLAKIAAAKGNPDLNYKTSIVDLMKLLDLDSSLDNRKELAAELGYTGAKDGSAEMNIWLHKAVMRELAKNGGKVPADLTD